MPLRLYLLTITDDGSALIEPFKAQPAIINGIHYHLIPATVPLTTPIRVPTPMASEIVSNPETIVALPKPRTGSKDFQTVRDCLIDQLLDAGDNGIPVIELKQILFEKLPTGTEIRLGPIISALARTNQIVRTGQGLDTRWKIK